MIIKRLTASFGKLQNESISFHEGLNVIEAPNESGKSTWCAFIRAMLYGVDSSERARAGHLPDKLRYAPWSGAPMEGSMELTANRSAITITRSTRSKNAPMREFSAVYTGTNMAVEGLNGTNAGEVLTGVSKDVFTRSAFIAQGAAAISGSPELEKRISAIVSTGEEQSSYSEADDRLRQWQRKRRYNRRGMLPELEGRMDEAQRKLKDMGSAMDEVQLLEERLEKTRQECAALEQAVTECRKKQRREALDRLNAGRAELNRSRDEHDMALARCNERREALRSSEFGGKDAEEFTVQVGKDLERLEELEHGKKKSRALLPAVICFILAVVCAAVYTAKRLIPVMVLGGVFCILAVVLLLRYAKARQAANNMDAERRGILKKYKAVVPADISAALERFNALSSAVDEALREERQLRDGYEQLCRRQEQLEAEALEELNFSGSGSTAAAELSRRLSGARADAERISGQIASLRGKLSATGDPMVIASGLGCMQDEYECIQKEYDAITLAIDVLRDADGEIQSRFSPELGKLAARYMAQVTAGRYEDVLLSRDFSARTRRNDDTVAHEAEYLSAGTLDIMYLAVRLAVCELALPDGEPCPLIIDDALVNLDGERMEQAMELLKDAARHRQVILFTCRAGK